MSPTLTTARRLLCATGLHHWTADHQQADDELAGEYDCYCQNCHHDRFDVSGSPNTQPDRFTFHILRHIWRQHHRFKYRSVKPSPTPNEPLPTGITIIRPIKTPFRTRAISCPPTTNGESVATRHTPR